MPASHSARPVVLVVQSWWIDEIYEGVAAAGLEKDWEVIAVLRHARGLFNVPPHVDGVIIYRGTDASLIGPIKKLGVPIVDIDPYDTAFDAPKVIWSDHELGRLAALHLSASDPRVLAFVQCIGMTPIVAARRAGFMSGAETAGIPAIDILWENFDAKELAARGHAGVFASNDDCAVRVMRNCLQAGVAVPDQISFVGADDNRLTCELLPVSLSSVSTGFQGRGRMAADLLEKLMAGEPAPKRSLFAPLNGVTPRRSTRFIDTGSDDLDRIVRHFRENAWRPVGAELLLEECGVPTRRALHLLKSRLQTSPLRLLRERRLKLAERFSAMGDLTVEAVASRAGFGTAAAWRRAKRDLADG